MTTPRICALAFCASAACALDACQPCTSPIELLLDAQAGEFAFAAFSGSDDGDSAACLLVEGSVDVRSTNRASDDLLMARADSTLIAEVLPRHVEAQDQSGQLLGAGGPRRQDRPRRCSRSSSG